MKRPKKRHAPKATPPLRATWDRAAGRGAEGRGEGASSSDRPPRAEPTSREAAPDRAAVVAYPHHPGQLDAARSQWLQSDWRALAEIPDERLLHHPDRARLATLSAAAALQLGERAVAQAFAERARAWGGGKAEIARVLLSGVHHTLGRASIAAGREAKADAWFDRSVAAARQSSEARRLAQQRRDAVQAELKNALAVARTLRRGQALPAAAAAPGWIVGLAGQCMDAADPLAGIDRVLDEVLRFDDEKLWFLLTVSDRLLARNDRLAALGFLHRAQTFRREAEPALQAELTRRLLALGGTDSAIDSAMQSALESMLDANAGAAAATSLREAFRRMREGGQATTEHGHDLLLAWMRSNLARLREAVPGRRLLLVEVGTTREDVPGQGSTRKLAQFCLDEGIDFVTVDMDPHNSHVARQTFERLGASFQAVTAKGEDFLREHDGPLDLVFLDAYDFDHGKHSELRQSRYEKFLGARIDEEACHRMHLDCAESVARKLSPWGAVCIDDAWLDGGRWQAKGALAMPYLLEHGFGLVEARNRAALLVRTAPSAAGPGA